MTSLTKKTPWTDRDFLATLRRGDAGGLEQLLLDHAGGDAAVALRAALDFAVELRRENVAVIGTHDVFVRHTPHGELEQVIAPVKLSLHDDTLYQMPVRTKYHEGTNRRYQDGDSGRYEWATRVPADQQHKATITAPGLNKINAVAGCAVGQPSVVIVDGAEKTNPYVERAQGARGRAGDIVRIVLAVNVVGPAPATGNPVVVQYTLDVDPSKDLQHMLMQIANSDNGSKAVYLIDEEQWEAFAETLEPATRHRWKWLPVYGGVGIAHDLRFDQVRRAYTKYVNIVQNALKKAQTVVRRNAMRQHPALAVQNVRIDDEGNVVLPVVGWRSNTRTMAAYAEVLDRLARGLPTEIQGVDVIDFDTTYDPEEHDIEDGDLAANVDPEVAELDPEIAERNALISQIDEGLSMLTSKQVASLDYQPAEQDAEVLRAVLTRVHALIDEGV